MPKSYRIRTTVGKDKVVNFDLNQDFDLLEVLSLSLNQTDVYTRMCADFGVVMGRVVVNGGFGVPNAKVSVFIPLDDEDAKNDVIRELYPFKRPDAKDENGKRYNLLSSIPTNDCHIAVGTFPELEDVLTSPQVAKVYKKYFKYTAKTNDSGDFMIYGIPVGTQTLVMDVDLSDIGCFSMLPQDFKEQGFPDSQFDGTRFKTDESIDSLPQIIGQKKVIDIRPFWGDEEFCSAAITRVDFDLADSGIEIKPTAVLMGGTATDVEKDSMNRRCKSKRKQGNLCNLVSQPGIIDVIRFTPFFEDKPYDCDPLIPTAPTPVLERYYLENSGRVIDESGSFLIHAPMNLDHIITNEFGEQVPSNDPSIGIATKGRYRFRIRPENDIGTAKNRRRASFLVPNIKEYNNDFGDKNGIQTNSYNFSINWEDYPRQARCSQPYDMITAGDYFYDFKYNKVYAVAMFHDHFKHRHRAGFPSIKEIVPTQNEQCGGSTMPFPINSAVRRTKALIMLSQIFTRFQQMYLYSMTVLFNSVLKIIFIALGPVLAIIAVICGFINLLPSWLIGSISGCNISFCMRCGGCCSNLANTSACLCCGCCYFGLSVSFLLTRLRQTKYPECEKCECRGNCVISSNYPNGWVGPMVFGDFDFAGGILTCGGDPHFDCAGGFMISTTSQDDLVCCPDNYGVHGFPSGGAPAGGCGGCIRFNICGNPGCPWGFSVIDEFRRRENIISALCKGIMNYYWENSWITGFLYNFQFKAKLEYDYATDTYTSDHCDNAVYFHQEDRVYYYRSTPFLQLANSTTPYTHGGGGSLTNAGSWGDPATPLQGWFLNPNPGHANGDNGLHLYWPTTITDLGPRNKCITEICFEKGQREGCDVAKQLGSTSYQPIEDLIGDIYINKAAFQGTTLGTLFPKPEKVIGGDVQQALMQNCMTGILVYESSFALTNCDCNMTPTTIPAFTGTGIGDTYMPASNSTVGSPSGGLQNQVYAQSENITYFSPIVASTNSDQILDGYDVITCLSSELSASTQYVPYFFWYLSNNNYGSQTNSWTSLTEDGPWDTPAGNAVGASVNQNLLWQNALTNFNTLTSTGNQQWGPIGYPNVWTLVPNPSPAWNMSLPTWHYFGLRPGETAMNKFVRLYIDEELSNEVI